LHVPAWLMGLQSLDALAVVTLQVAVGLLVRRLLPVRAVLLAIFISSAGVALMSAAPSVGLAALGVLAFACGEMIYSAHFYQYLGSLAPAGQVGMYMGFAFLPIALGSFLSGQIGAPVVTYFRESLHAPQLMWLVFAGVGAVSALGVFFVARAAQARTGARR
jgi:POT family proton-dependent oligopeptide transporter